MREKHKSGVRRRLRRGARVWLRRGLLWVVLPAALLFAMRLGWGWEAAHRLARVHADLRARGVRIDHPPVTVAAADNPAAALMKAVESAPQLSADENKLLWGDGTIPEDQIVWTDAQKVTIRAILERHQASFGWIDAAARRTGKIPPVGMDFLNGKLVAQRQLCKLLLVQAQFEVEAGDDAAALCDLERIHTIADIEDHGGVLIYNLVAIANRGLLGQAVERLEPHLGLANAGARAQARVLLTRLQDSAPAEAVARNFESEIGYVADFAENDRIFHEWWIRPLRDDEVGREQVYMGNYVAGFHARDWPEAQRLMPMTGPPRDGNLQLMTYWDEPSVLTFRKIMTLYFRSRSDLNAAALLLAAQMYTAEQGTPPRVATDLVPAYLAEVPTDPFSAAHDPMHFRLDPAGVTVWSVGENGRDDGGPVLLDSSGQKLRRYDVGPRSQPDIVYGAAWRMAVPPATATAPAPGPAAGTRP